MSDASKHLGALLARASIDDHEEILEAAKKAVARNGEDLNLWQTQIVALLKLDRFEDALRVVSEGGDRVQKRCYLETAYALYKTGKHEDARELLKSAPESRGLNHLRAQVTYRGEFFDETAILYRKLDDATEDEGEASEVSINSLANSAQLAWAGLGDPGVDMHYVSSAAKSLDSFEAAYNLACICIAHGRLSRAIPILQKAIRLCDESDGLTDSEKQAELVPIMIQLAYVFAHLGRRQEAIDTYRSVASMDDIDSETQILGGINNAVLSLSTDNPYLANRQIEQGLKAAGKQKMFTQQTLQLKQLQFASDLNAYKAQGVEAHILDLFQQPKSSLPQSSLAPFSPIHAVAHARSMNPTELLSATAALLERYPKNIGLLFTIVQICVRAKDSNKALTYVENFLQKLDDNPDEDTQPIRFTPALVALAVSLYRLSGRTKSVESELAGAVAFWSSQSGRVPATLLREASLQLITSHNPEHVRLAVNAFQKLNELDPNDTIPQIGLLASAGLNKDPNSLKPLLGRVNLPSADDLSSGVDVAALTKAGILAAPTTDALQAKSTKRPAQRDEQPTNAKRRRRKPPKSAEEGAKPDPERWLPLRDRSYYRPKGKKGRKKASEATQGGISKDEETLELVGGAGAVKVEKAPGLVNKKKKKGRK